MYKISLEHCSRYQARKRYLASKACHSSERVTIFLHQRLDSEQQRGQQQERIKHRRQKLVLLENSLAMNPLCFGLQVGSSMITRVDRHYSH